MLDLNHNGSKHIKTFILNPKHKTLINEIKSRIKTKLMLWIENVGPNVNYLSLYSILSSRQSFNSL